MAKKYIVRLTEEERSMLTALVGKGQASAQKIKHANVLLKVGADGPNWGDEQAAEAFECAPRTVFSIRERFVEQGLDAALTRKPRIRLSREPLLDNLMSHIKPSITMSLLWLGSHARTVVKESGEYSKRRAQTVSPRTGSASWFAEP